MTSAAAGRYLAEFLGTFMLLVLAGGTAVFTLLGGQSDARILLVALAFGLTVVALVYAFGDVSGGHFNPAVTLSMAVARKMPLRDVGPYLVSQFLGGIVGVAVILGIASGSAPALSAAQGGALASQCYASSTAPAGCGFSLAAVFLAEVVLTFVFVLVIHAVARPDRSPKNLAPLAIGLTLAVGNMIAIPIDGSGLNPARSLAPALLSAVWPGSVWAIQQVWLFVLAPVLGGVAAALVDRMFPPKS
jgi:aquaporin Z